jgi:hypothetical protein
LLQEDDQRGAVDFEPRDERLRREARMTRAGALLGIGGAVAIGLASRMVPLGSWVWDKSVGDVCFAVMIGFLVACCRPRARASVVGAITAAACFLIEAFQLTGWPRRAPWVIRRALGDTFAWHDLACYAVGAMVVALVVRSRRAAPR